MYKLFLTGFIAVLTLLSSGKVMAQDEVASEPYIHDTEFTAASKVAAWRSLIDTFNSYGYLIDTFDKESGVLSASIIDYSSFYKGDKFSGINELANMQQTMDVKLLEIEPGNFQLSLRLIYQKDVVTVLEPYQTFVATLEQSHFLN